MESDEHDHQEIRFSDKGMLSKSLFVTCIFPTSYDVLAVLSVPRVLVMNRL